MKQSAKEQSDKTRTQKDICIQRVGLHTHTRTHASKQEHEKKLRLRISATKVGLRISKIKASFALKVTAASATVQRIHVTRTHTHTPTYTHSHSNIHSCLQKKKNVKLSDSRQRWMAEMGELVAWVHVACGKLPQLRAPQSKNRNRKIATFNLSPTSNHCQRLITNAPTTTTRQHKTQQHNQPLSELWQ